MDNILTDLTITVAGAEVEALKQVGPEEAGPYLEAAGFMANFAPVELIFSNPEVYVLATLAINSPNITVSLAA